MDTRRGEICGGLFVVVRAGKGWYTEHKPTPENIG